MANTWVTDLTHLLDDAGRFPHPALPGPARRLGAHLIAIVWAATQHHDPSSQKPQIHCRRRPAHRLCPGIIIYRILVDTQVNWSCPRCGDNGFISNWQGTSWDWSSNRQVH